MAPHLRILRPDDQDRFYERISGDLTLQKTDAVILFCAAMIACIGLNMNSSVVTIGAMLISPLMTPIVGIGVGFAVYDWQMIWKGLKILGIEIVVALAAATIYFLITPVTEASSEILARTSPTTWDILVAIFGGIAGTIGVIKKDNTNLIAGVSIATALMPPLCTVGYALTKHNMSYMIGAVYLFVINFFFIVMATTFTTRLMNVTIPKQVIQDRGRWAKWIVTLVTIIIIVPSLFSAANMVNRTLQTTHLNQFISEQLTNQAVISKTIDDQNKIIRLTVSGETIPQADVAKLQTDLRDYHLNDMTLKLTQVASLSTLSGPDFEHYLAQLVEKNSSNSTITEEQQVTKETSASQAELVSVKEAYPKLISEIYFSDNSSNETTTDCILIATLGNISNKNKTKIITLVVETLGVDEDHIIFFDAK